MTRVHECTSCHGPRVQRSRTALADALREAVRLSLRDQHGLQSLHAHLLWFELELRGYCTNCTLEAVAEPEAVRDHGRRYAPRLCVVTTEGT